MILYIINYLVLFIVGILIVTKSKLNYDIIKEKLMFLYYRLLSINGKEDLTAKYLIHKYIEDEKIVDIVFEEFKENNTLMCDNEFNYNFIKREIQDSHFNQLRLKTNQSSSSEISYKPNQIDLVVVDKKVNRALIREDSTNKILSKSYKKKINIKFKEEDHESLKSLRSQTQNEEENEPIIVNSSFTHLKRKLNLEHIHKNEDICDEIIHTFLRKSRINRLKNKLKLKTNHNNKSYIDEQKSYSYIKDNLYRINSIKSISSNQSHYGEDASILKREKRNRSFSVSQSIAFENTIKSKLDNMKYHQTIQKSHKNQDYVNEFISQSNRKNIIDYYNSLFELIEKYLTHGITNEFQKHSNIHKSNCVRPNSNHFENNKSNINSLISNSYIYKGNLGRSIKLYNEMTKQKDEMIENVTQPAIPKFFAVDSMKIDINGKNQLDECWEKLVLDAKKHNIEVKLTTKEVIISPSFVISQVMNPPVISCLLGIFLGVSGLREVIFSENHYIKNCYFIYRVISGSFIPLVCVNAGYALVNSPKINLNFSITKLQIGVSYLLWLVVFPIIGYCVLLLFDVIYGNLISTSKVFRYSIFIPYALPATANLVILLNIVGNYYLNEYAYILSSETKSVFISQTLLLVIFFVIEG